MSGYDSDLVVGQPISVCLVNPEGDSRGWWHGFPCTTEELQATLKEIGIPKDFIFTCDIYATDSHVQKHLPKNLHINNFDELNYLAARLGEMSTDEREIFEAVMEARLHCGSLKDIINVDQNLDKFDIQPAYSPEDYGAFKVEMGRDEYAATMNSLEASSDPAERDFFTYVAGIEAHIDLVAYGKWCAENEGAVFTENGLLTELGGFQEIYKGIQDIPAEYKVFVMPAPESFLSVKNTDLTALLAKMHAVGGEYMADMSYNLSTLESKRSAEYLMVMNGRNIFLTEAAHAYRRGTAAFDTVLNASETLDTKAFALHVTNVHDVHVMGDLVGINLRELQLDVLHHSIHPTHIDATTKFGKDVSFTPDEWTTLEPIDRDRLESWTRRFDSADHQAVRRHLDDVVGHHENNSKPISEDAFLSDLNANFREHSQYSQPDMLRIDLAAAKDLLSHGDVPVYRLLPEEAKELNSLYTLPSRGGLWFQEHREFAVKKTDIDGLDRWANRAADEAVKSTKHRAEPEKLKVKEPEL